MNIANTVKTLCAVGVTSLGLYAGASQADFDGYRGNPYLSAPHAHFDAGFKQQMEEFDIRMDRQLQRILGGMEAGKLTMKEAIRLLQEHQAISALERQYLRDGRLGPRELFDLDRRLDQASQHIFWEKQDYERTGFNGRYGGWYR
jgi:hypothetical protein